MSILKPNLPQPWTQVSSGELNDVFTDLSTLSVDEVNIAEEGLNTNHIEENALIDYAYSFLFAFPSVSFTVNALNVGIFQNIDLPLASSVALDNGELLRYNLSIPILNTLQPTLNADSEEAGEQNIYFKLQLEVDTGGGPAFVDVNEPRGFSLTITGSEARIPLPLSGQYVRVFYYETINLTGLYFGRSASTVISRFRLQYTLDSALPTVNAGQINGFVLAVRR
jgi:hypothetical protein